jgi:hypothetical protein
MERIKTTQWRVFFENEFWLLRQNPKINFVEMICQNQILKRAFHLSPLPKGVWLA